MKIIDYRKEDFEDALKAICERSAFQDDINEQVAEILQEIRQDGDAAVCHFAEKFDGAKIRPDNFRVNDADLTAATFNVDDATKTAIELACEHVTTFAEQRLPKDWSFEPRDGVILGERFAPLQRVAAYIPGGSAPLVSTVLHTVAMAKAAGVPEIVVVSPPDKEGDIHPAILHAAQIAGATDIYRLGGVYAIGALAYGTETIKKVDKIVGPGNAYVTAAKRQVYGQVSLDLVAGPSEVLIVADETANPAYIAADMLAQAEHGSGYEQAVLATDCESLISAVEEEIQSQLKELSRQDCIKKVLATGVFAVLCKDMVQVVEVANRYASEHLEVLTIDPRATAKDINCCGAMFLGPWTPEPVGDFVAGPSHVLPTGGAARYFNGLTVEQFCRRISVIEYQEEALKNEAEALAAFAKIEELDAHGNSVAIRFKK